MGAQQTSPTEQTVPDQYVLHVNAELVVLSATVVNDRQALVSGLSSPDFSIYENGIQQQINVFTHEDIPATIGILIDNSGSMSTKRNDVISAAMSFVRSSNPQDEMFIVSFNDDVRFGLPNAKPFTDQHEQLLKALEGIRPTGQTSLYDAILAGLMHLSLGTRDKKVLILISDGGDTSSKATLRQVLATARQTAAIVYVVAIFDEQDGDQNPAVLKRLTKQTGGDAYFPETTQEIAGICDEIAHNIRNQYTLAYTPSNASHDGQYRAIVVTAHSKARGHMTVKTRSGYQAPLDQPSAPSKPLRP